MKNSSLFKNLIEFMWIKYSIPIIFSSEENKNKNILGQYRIYLKETTPKNKKIIINLNNINDENLIIFVLLHEIGHFILEKNKITQNENYADFLAYYLLRQLSKKNLFLSSNLFENLNLIPIFFIHSKIKRKLIQLGKIYYYDYLNYLKEVR